MLGHSVLVHFQDLEALHLFCIVAEEAWSQKDVRGAS